MFRRCIGINIVADQDGKPAKKEDVGWKEHFKLMLERQFERTSRRAERTLV
jgi:hypothetical protein